MTEDDMVEWHHQLDGHEFEQALGKKLIFIFLKILSLRNFDCQIHILWFIL